MKKKLKIGLLCSLFVFLLVGCLKKDDNIKELDINQEDGLLEDVINEVDYDIEEGKELLDLLDLNSQDINVSDLKYYYYISEVVEDFYTYYEKLGNSIDEKNETNYMRNLKEIKDLVLEVKNYEVQEYFDEAHQYLVKSLSLYMEGVEKLKESYSSISVEKYKESNNILISASSNMTLYYSYIANFYEDYAEYLNSFFETDYYLTNLNFYEYNESFLEDENNFLFKMIRYLELLTYSRENLMKEIIMGDKSKAEGHLNNFNKYYEEILKLDIDNENLKLYKEKLSEYLKIYVDAVQEYYNEVKGETINYEAFEITEKLRENAENVYNVISHIADFYNEHGIDIGFRTTDEQRAMEETVFEE